MSWRVCCLGENLDGDVSFAPGVRAASFLASGLDLDDEASGAWGIDGRDRGKVRVAMDRACASSIIIAPITGVGHERDDTMARRVIAE